MTMLVLVTFCAAAAQPAWRLVSQIIWLRFCNRLLMEPDGIERLRQAAPHVLAGLDAVNGHLPRTSRPPSQRGRAVAAQTVKSLRRSRETDEPPPSAEVQRNN
jgi:hypothetical protein